MKNRIQVILTALLILSTFQVKAIPLLYSFWEYDEYLNEFPEQKQLVADLRAAMMAPPVPLSVPQQRPIKISVIHPGEQASDYWRRSVVALERRLQYLGIKYELNRVSTRLNLDIREQSSSLLTAIKNKSDYLIFTLNTSKHRKFIEHVLQNPDTKLILQNITTPIKAWHGHQPFMYVGFDHILGTRALAKYYQERFPDGAKYALLYYSQGYLSAARGDTFIEKMREKEQYSLQTAFYTKVDHPSSYRSTVSAIKEYPDIDFIYASSTDISLGAKDALLDNDARHIEVNGWGGGSAELEALEKGDIDVTVMRMNDDTAIAIAEAIKMDLQNQKTATVFSGDFEIVTKDITKEKLEQLKARAFRYSDMK